jgi:hypothetical protein
MTTSKLKKAASAISSSILDFSAGNGATNNVNQTLSQIPSYEDVGIKYQGFSKTLITDNQYKLNRQTRRYYELTMGAGTAAGDHTINRSLIVPGSTGKFYCSTIHIDCSTNVSPTLIKIFDGVTNSYRSVFAVGTNEVHFDVNPRDSFGVFNGDTIIINISDQINPIGGFLSVAFYGWEE